jgi:hypothetical protein
MKKCCLIVLQTIIGLRRTQFSPVFRVCVHKIMFLLKILSILLTDVNNLEILQYMVFLHPIILLNVPSLYA